MERPTDQRRIEIEPSLRRMILIELIFPMVLLILGIYHGLMQVLYRAGIIQQPPDVRAGILPGTDPARRRQRDRLHDLLCRRVRLRSRALSIWGGRST